MHQFKGSAHFISNCIKRNNRIAVNLHGEANTYEPEERKQIMDKWKKNELHPLIEKYSVPAERIYNADQTGLFYQKLPNKLYVNKDKKNNYSGAKQMKDKTRITLMVCTAADGKKVSSLLSFYRIEQLDLTANIISVAVIYCWKT